MFNVFVLTYILDNGIDNVKKITNEEIEVFIKEQKEYQNSLKGTNKHPIMTVEFQVNVIEEAIKICQKDREEVLSYIKKGMKSFR